MANKKGFILILAVLVMALLAGLYSCKKTESPLGVYGPYGLDRPTMTPTPAIGAIEILVKDTNFTPPAVQGVSVVLVDPSGNTFGANATQPSVGYAAFNPPDLFTGIWTAIVPTQSVTNVFVSSGPTTTTNKYTFGRSTLPITVTGGGQYSVTFTTGGNTVAISPVSQTMGTSLPDFLPVTVSYTENGNLDVPVSVTLQGYPSILGFSLTNSPDLIFGGGVNTSAITIVKNTCYYQPIILTSTVNDFSGTPVGQFGATITRGFQIPVTLVTTKVSGGGVTEYLEVGVQTANDCGASIYNVSFNFGGKTIASGTVANGGSVSYNEHQLNYTVYATVSTPWGTINAGSFQIGNIPFSTWTVLGTANY